MHCTHGNVEHRWVNIYTLLICSMEPRDKLLWSGCKLAEIIIIVCLLGLEILTNIIRGHVYGCVCEWRKCKRRQLGVHLLYKAFRSFLIHTPQELLEQDI